jgi:hypothetical protein
MIAFIKNYSLLMMKKKFIVLYLLNLLDITFTLLLLQTGYFQEVNFFMVKVVENPLISILLKVILPAILLYYMYYKSKDSDTSQLKVTNIALNISLTLYALVNLSHLVWTALLPVFILYY